MYDDVCAVAAAFIVGTIHVINRSDLEGHAMMLEIKMLRKRKLWMVMVCVLLCGVLSAVDLNEKATEHRALYADALERRTSEASAVHADDG